MITTLNSANDTLEIELHSGVSPQAVINEVRTLLRRQGIDPEGKISSLPGFGSFISVSIPARETAEAIQQMLNQKFPREKEQPQST